MTETCTTGEAAGGPVGVDVAAAGVAGGRPAAKEEGGDDGQGLEHEPAAAGGVSARLPAGERTGCRGREPGTTA